ncbi:unnamed protein product [Bursaphelenchus okinawaensis]|uniref:Uncharacterized protein n=1 Tax=Bursaphelenchus okinawaensis TaxID=465554 RepID=A0A811K5J2_9BILA|nr:unnamed protein product [Bursaphelenchus okinawaensis]CAG9091709.1 unnamed protein product [Bursaphelenchus okinawaensis]
MKLYQKWFDTGMSSIFSAIANKKLKKRRKSITKKFGKCSAEADDLKKHARCVSNLLKNKYHANKPQTISRFNRYQPKVLESTEESAFKQVRSRRSIKTVESYHIKNSKAVISPMMQIARTVYESVKKATNKTELPKWQDTVQKLQEQKVELKKKKKLLEDNSEENLDNMGLKGLQAQINKNDIEFDGDLEEIQKDPVKTKKLLSDLKKKKQNTLEGKTVELIRSAMELGYKLAGQNTTNFYNNNLKIASPKFLELFPEKQDNDTINLISPSLFALHDSKDPIENLTSIPTLMKDVGLQDQQLWMDIIMEAAGINNHSEQLEEKIKAEGRQDTEDLIDGIKKMVDENGVPLYQTQQNATVLGTPNATFEYWEKIRNSYSKEQLREMNHTGYAILRKDQIETLYGPASPMRNDEKYHMLMNMTEDEIHTQIDENIHELAEVENFKLRQKDIVLSPVYFTWVVLNPALTSQPYILSPLAFDPIILSPSIWGAVILTPWIFTPFVLSPRILGGIILSPWIFGPIILTPIALHPAILSPGVFNPIVLSPLLLTPFILSPQVFTPLILSPLCLDPIILNPLVGSPLVLSPFVLTPTILSPHFLGGLIMSPYALSPVILSPLTAFVALLSPSWLS